MDGDVLLYSKPKKTNFINRGLNMLFYGYLKMFLRKQLSEAAQPESRMRSRVARRGKLQRDDYVVRMLRISRSFVVISWAK